MATATINELEKFIKAYQSSTKDESASFSYKDAEDIIYLTVTPPRGVGRHIKAENIIKRLKANGIDASEKVDYIKQIIKLTEQRNIQIYNCPVDVKRINIVTSIEQSKEVTVHISDDAMTAYLDINISQPKRILPRDFIKILKNAGVIFGVSMHTLEKLSKYLEQNAYSKRVLVAKGREEEKGHDARFKLKPGFKQIQSSVEFRSEILPKNTLVAIKEPLVKTLAQKLVTGEEVDEFKSRSKDVKIIRGRGIKELEKENGSIVYITIHRGIVVFNKIHKTIDLIPVVDAEYSLTFTADKTSVFFDAITGKNKISDLKIEHVLKDLKNMGVEDKFIDMREVENCIKRINNKNIGTVQGAIVAKGRKPVNGEDGSIVFPEDFGKYRKIHYREDGSVDHRLSTSVFSFKPGDIIAEIIPPNQNKKDGVNVCGRVIYAKDGKWPNVKLGDGVRKSEDGLKLVATKDGQLRKQGIILKIIPVLLIPGDVDYSTGSINFKGSVKINGNVLDGFNIFCSGDLIIGGNIGACRIVCEGDAIIKGGVAGKNKASIFIGGNLSINYVEQARVETRGDIFIKKTATLSRIYSAKDIVFNIKNINTAVIGCRLMAKQVVDVSKIGSHRGGAESSIIVGFDYDAIRTNKRIQKQLVKVQSEIMKINKSKELIKENENPEELQQLDENLEVNLKRFDQLLIFQNEILKRMEIKTKSILIVRKAIFPYATVIMDNYKKQIRETEKSCVFCLDYTKINEIHFEKYNPRKQYYTIEEDS
mgnify:CR=1 FL=1